jgi:hypothetical protein
MNLKQTIGLVGVSIVTISTANPTNAATVVSTNPPPQVYTQGKIAGFVEDAFGAFGGFIKDNSERIRAETIGRGFEQRFLGEISESDLANLRAQRGGDWAATVTDWCNGMATAQGGEINIPYITNTWRVENGKANCYLRIPNGPFK